MNCSAAQLLNGIKERLVGLAKACDGTAAVETAVVLIPFLLLLFGMIEGGFLIWTQSNLQFAVEAAARCAAVNPTVCGSTAAIQSYAASQIVGLPITTSSFSVSQPTCGWQVSIVYPYSSSGFIVPALFSGALNLNASSCHAQQPPG
jgi:Flp pilus assembly protein TadG